MTSWNQHVRWTVDGPTPAVTVDSFADSTLDIGLTAAKPNDFASIAIDLGDVVDLRAFGPGPVSGSFSSSANGTATVVIRDGHLRGSDSTALSIDVTASLPAEHATVTIHLTDDLNLHLRGRGYVGSTITQTAESGGSVQVFSQTGTPGESDNGNFDLARFVAAILHTDKVAVQFVASAPGESIHGNIESVFKITATADLPGPNGHMQHLVFNETVPQRFSFSDASSDAHVPHLAMISAT